MPRQVMVIDGNQVTEVVKLPVLKPDFYLPFTQSKGMRQFYSALSREVAVELEFFLQFQCLVACVCLSASASLVGIGS